MKSDKLKAMLISAQYEAALSMDLSVWRLRGLTKKGDAAASPNLFFAHFFICHNSRFLADVTAHFIYRSF